MTAAVQEQTGEIRGVQVRRLHVCVAGHTAATVAVGCLRRMRRPIAKTGATRGRDDRDSAHPEHTERGEKQLPLGLAKVAPDDGNNSHEGAYCKRGEQDPQGAAPQGAALAL